MLNNIAIKETRAKKALKAVKKTVGIGVVVGVEVPLAVATTVIYGTLSVGGALLDTGRESIGLAKQIKEDVKDIYNE